MSAVVRSWLSCSRCGQPRAHEVRYLGPMLRSVRCLACGRLLRPPAAALREAWIGGLPERFVSKPGRVLSEARERPIRFALGLPGRLASKPARLANEVSEVIVGEA